MQIPSKHSSSSLSSMWAVGALISAPLALLAFLFLPYGKAEVGADITDLLNTLARASTTSASTLPTSTPLFEMKAIELTLSASFGVQDLARINGLIWIEVIPPIVIALVAALLVFKSNPFGLTRTPIATQRRWGAYSFIATGVLGIVIQFGIFSAANQTLQDTLSRVTGTFGSSLFGSSVLHTTVNFETGAWIFLLSMLVVVANGALLLIKQAPAQSTVAQSAFPAYQTMSSSYTTGWVPTQTQTGKHSTGLAHFAPQSPQDDKYQWSPSQPD